MPFHRQPTMPKCDIADDIRDFVKAYSDDKAELKTLERLSALDLTVLALAFEEMKRRWQRDMEIAQ